MLRFVNKRVLSASRTEIYTATMTSRKQNIMYMLLKYAHLTYCNGCSSIKLGTSTKPQRLNTLLKYTVKPV